MKKTFLPLSKGQKYLEKHGYLKLFCGKCGIVFFCSGQCLRNKDKNELDGYYWNVCICAKCDLSKEHSSDWYKSCKKDFPFDWIGLLIDRNQDNDL